MTESLLVNKLSKSAVFLGVILISFPLWAQPDVELKKYQEKYPGQHVVILDKVEELHIERKNGDLVIYETFYSKRMFLTSQAGQFREDQLSYSNFTSIDNIEAVTSIPNGKKYKSVKTKEFIEQDDLESDVFYDDTKIIGFEYEGLQEGGLTELRYTRNIKDPHFLGRVLMQWAYPIEKQTYRIIVDKGVDLGYTEYQFDQDFISFSKTDDKGVTTYEWVATNAPIFKSDKWSPSITYYTPQVIPRIKSYQGETETVNVLRNEADLFHWYESMTDTLNSDKNDPNLQAIVDSITNGITNEKEKVKRIFEWTQDNIKYVAYEDGLGGFIPRSAASVCTNRFGDCKDMSSTITQLLDYAGIPSHLTWIGTHSIPFKYKEVPTPAVDNHMIATYIDKDNKHYFMDATGRYMPFGLPSGFIQGKEALIQLKKGEFEIYTVPVVDEKVNIILDSVNATITDGVFTGTAVNKLGGYSKQSLEYRIEDLTDEKKAKFFKSYFTKGNNKFLPENFKESHAYPDPAPYEVAYNFTIGDYIMTLDNEVYVNLNLMDFFSGDKLKEDRETPFQFKHKSLFKNVVHFTVPEGYTVDFLPKPLSVDNELMYYHSSYEVNGNVVTYTMYSSKKRLNYNVSDIPLWNKSVSQINKSQKNVIILKKSI